MRYDYNIKSRQYGIRETQSIDDADVSARLKISGAINNDKGRPPKTRNGLAFSMNCEESDEVLVYGAAVTDVHRNRGEWAYTGISRVTTKSFWSCIEGGSMWFSEWCGAISPALKKAAGKLS